MTETTPDSGEQGYNAENDPRLTVGADYGSPRGPVNEGTAGDSEGKPDEVGEGSAALGSDPGAEGLRVTPEELERAMATYSADGQVDDATGGDAAAEQLRATDPSVDPNHIGPN